MLSATWTILNEAAIFVLVGFAIAGLLEGWLAGGRLLRFFKGDSPRSVILATLLGVPLPLCSCSVLPTAVTLRKRGASKGATLSFLISTPETSVTSILLTYALMGPLLAVVRPLAAAATAISAGLAENALTRYLLGTSKRAASDDDGAPDGDAADVPAAREEHGHATHEHAAQAHAEHTHAGHTDAGHTHAEHTHAGHGAPEEHGDTCGHDHDHDHGDHSHEPAAFAADVTPPAGAAAKLQQGMRFAFVDLFDDIFGWMMVGILAAAAIQVWLPPDALATLTGGAFTTMLVMVVIGVPLYVCAEASTPIAAALVAQGLDPGAALVFLLVGPATNIGSLGVLDKMLGRRTVAVYLAAIIIVALVMGGLLNLFVGSSELGLQMRALEEPLVPDGVKQAGALAFLALGLASARRLRYGPRSATWLDRWLPFRVTSPRLLASALVAVVLLWAGSGLFTVAPGELGVIKRFGAIEGAPVGPGLHYALPAPFGSHDTIDVTGVRRTVIGLLSDDPRSLPDREASWHLVGDENIAELILSVHWGAHADGALAFQYGVADQEALVRNVVLAMVRRQLGGMSISQALTTHRLPLERELLALVRARLDVCKSGVAVHTIQILDAHAPIEVHAAFRDVAGALEDRATQIHDARAREASQLPEARGDAERIVAEARGEAARSVHRARGEAHRFSALIDVYDRWPEVTRKRMQLEALERVLPRMRKYLKPTESDDGNLEIWFTGPDGELPLR